MIDVALAIKEILENGNALGALFSLRDRKKTQKIYPVLVVNLVPVLPATVYFTGQGLATSSFYQSQ